MALAVNVGSNDRVACPLQVPLRTRRTPAQWPSVTPIELFIAPNCHGNGRAPAGRYQTWFYAIVYPTVCIAQCAHYNFKRQFGKLRHEQIITAVLQSLYATLGRCLEVRIQEEGGGGMGVNEYHQTRQAKRQIASSSCHVDNSAPCRRPSALGLLPYDSIQHDADHGLVLFCVI